MKRSWPLETLLWTCLTMTAMPALAAPLVPTYMLQWGGLGAGPGQMNFPAGVATDELGNVYVVDQGNHRVQKFDRTGAFITQWGSYGSGNGQFASPGGIAVDLSGNLYVVDGGNIRIQKFTSNGTYLTQWGSFGSGPGQFTGLGGSPATDAAGNVYVASAHRIQKFTSAGAFVTEWGSQGTGDGQFDGPISVATDAAGNVYVVDRLNMRVQKFTSSGVFVTQWALAANTKDIAVDPRGDVYVCDDACHVTRYGSTGVYEAQWGSAGAGNGQFTGPGALDVDLAGNVYVADSWNNRVQKFSGAGATWTDKAHAYLLQWGTPGSGAAQFSQAHGVACDPAGNVYVVDLGNNRVQKFTAAGSYVTAWSSAGPMMGSFNQPIGVATDAAGFVYVTDGGNQRVQKYLSNGTWVDRWGAFGSGDGEFNQPSGIAADQAGHVYVADLILCKIQKFTTSGVYVSQWGTFGAGNGEFSFPFGVAADALGNVYVADTGNHRVQKFTASGVYVTQWGSNGTGDGQFQSPHFIAADARGDVYVTDYAGHRVQRFRADGTFVASWGSLGSGDGQLDLPTGIAVDFAGNVVVADQSLNRMQKFAAAPAIALASDVRNDQGRSARLRILRGSADAAGSGVPVTGYAIYRRIDPPPSGANAALARRPATPASAALEGWDYVATIPARGDPEYNAVVPTLVDANGDSPNFSAFFVSALTASPTTYFDSLIESGWSIDNLSPPAPTPFLAAYALGSTHLHWGVSTASDFATFRLYRGASADFVPGPGNFVTATTDTGYVDAGAPGSYYKLAAVDLNGNESPYALAGPGQTVEVPGEGVALEFGLEEIRPSPVPGRELTVRFALAGGTEARLELIDVAGRRIAEQRVSGAGRYAVSLGRERDLPAGVYLVRLTQGSSVRTRRAVVLD